MTTFRASDEIPSSEPKLAIDDAGRIERFVFGNTPPRWHRLCDFACRTPNGGTMFVAPPTGSSAEPAMWDWINCHLAGRHEFIVWPSANQVCLRCLRCGRRSSGWQVAGDAHHPEGPVRDEKGSHGLLAGALSLLGLSLAER